MLIYLLKSGACLAFFMLFYKLVLEQSSMHHFKRFYLLAALLLAFIIPKITFVEYIAPGIYNFEGLTTATEATFTESLPKKETFDVLPILLWTFYALGVLVFLFKFCLNLFRIYSCVRHNPTCKSKGFIQVLLERLITPHTFFNYIFLNKSKFETHQIPEEVLLHEQTHARQKHSIDVIVLELFQIVFWFNPLIYLLKKDIKLNHEFLADRAVLKQGFQTASYQSILLVFSSKASHQHLANAINYSSIKKRFTVMKTQSTPRSIWLRSLLILPLLAMLLYGFTQREQVVKEDHLSKNAMKMAPKSMTAQSANQQETKQDGATKSELVEYNKLAKHYNSQADDNHRIIKLKDMRRLRTIYDKMSTSQKANAEPLPNFPPPPPPPPAPNATVEQKKAHESTMATYNDSTNSYTYKHKNKKGELVTVTVITDNEIIPPPPPPPAIPQTPEALKRSQKAAAAYAKAHPESVTQSKDDEAIDIVEMPIENPFEVTTRFINVEGLLIYEVTIDGKSKYYNPQGFEVDDQAQKISKSQVDASDVIPGQYITKVYKDNKVVVEFKDNLDHPQILQEAPTPPAPPAPLSPLELIKTMTQSNADFYFENERISAKKAKDLLTKNKELNIEVHSINSDTPKVHISKAPITEKTYKKK